MVCTLTPAAAASCPTFIFARPFYTFSMNPVLQYGVKAFPSSFTKKAIFLKSIKSCERLLCYQRFHYPSLERPAKLYERTFKQRDTICYEM